MGLDQYLEARKYVSNWTMNKPEEKEEHRKVVEALGLGGDDISPDYQSISVEVPVAYWRKATQIHRWFVDNVQDGVDNCADYSVSREQLEELHDICKEIMETPRIADDLLPVNTDHSTPITDYNQWYFEQIAETIKMLRKVLDNEKFMCYDFIYKSSW